MPLFARPASPFLTQCGLEDFGTHVDGGEAQGAEPEIAEDTDYIGKAVTLALPAWVTKGLQVAEGPVPTVTLGKNVVNVLGRALTERCQQEYNKLRLHRGLGYYQGLQGIPPFFTG